MNCKKLVHLLTNYIELIFLLKNKIIIVVMAAMSSRAHGPDRSGNPLFFGPKPKIKIGANSRNSRKKKSKRVSKIVA
jgi:hypothetical protein